MATKFKNTVLSHLDADVVARLELRPVTLEVGRTIEAPGSEIRNLYFIESGLGSMTTVFRDGHQVEVGLFGWESVLGVSAFMGTIRSKNSIFMQVSGDGYISPLKVAEQEYRRYERFHELCLRYVQAQLMQTAQTGACNAIHDIQQRFARWLLLSRERLDSDVVPLTHEFLSQMLGVQRSSVSLTAGALHDLGLIEYSRGKIKIRDQEGLEARACECYQVVREHLNNYHEIDAGFAI